MARDGSGTYTRVEGPYVNGVVADADEMNNELDDISDAITDSINSSGTKAMGANWSMGGFRLTDLAAPSSANDAARKAYVDSAITAAAQPLDPALTAFSALSWASGNPLVQFTAADTVSLTLTPSVSSVTASQGAAATTPSATFVNTTDNASVRALRIEGDRATPANSDVVYASYYLSNLSGTQVEVARITGIGLTLTAGAEVGRLRFSLSAAGAISDRLILSTSGLFPASNDLLSCGVSGSAFSDAYWASGAVHDFGAGNYTLTHSSGTLEASGTFRARVPLSSETTTPTSASANKKMVLTGGATINTGTADDFYLLDPGTSARTITRGSGMTMYLNGVDAATATLAANQLGSVHYRSASVVVLSGAFS